MEAREHLEVGVPPRGRHSTASVPIEEGDQWGHSERLEYWTATLFNHIRANRKGEVALALGEGCPVNIMEPGTGDTPLIVACRYGWVGIAALCLDYGAKNDPHPHFGKTALQVHGNPHAPSLFFVSVVPALISNGAPCTAGVAVGVNLIVLYDGSHCTQTAVEAGQYGCLKELLEAAAHANMDVTIANHMDDTKSTPLHIAARHGDVRCLTLLLEVH